MTAGDDPIVLVCTRVRGRESAPMPDATVGRCDRCDDEVWISPSAPAERQQTICLTCAPILLAADPEATFMDPTPAQRAATVAAGADPADTDEAHRLITAVLRKRAARVQREECGG